MSASSSFYSIRNKTVVITGASSGVGRAAALEFAKHGALLVLAARREEALQEIANACIALGTSAIALPTDVTDPDAVARLAEAADDFGDGIDVWINNAGVLAVGPFDEIPADINSRVIETNLIGYMNGAHAVLPYFKRQGRGILINNISVGGWMLTPYGVAYSASKFGLRGFSGALQGELSAWPGIHVCAMYPAFLDTPGIQHAANFTGAQLKPAPPVFDPARVARAMVRLAINPKRSSAPDLAAPLLRLAYTIAPRLVGQLAEATMRGWFNRAGRTAQSDGNLYDSDTPLTPIRGGWQARQRRDTVKATLLTTGIIVGLGLLLRKGKMR